MAIHLHKKAELAAPMDALNQLPRKSEAMLDARGEFDHGSCGVMLESGLGHAYNEETFQLFLAIERKRSERSNRSFLLLLLDLKKQPGADVDIAPLVAARLFSGLTLCLRETDFVGWYREGRVVGAVLTQFEDAPGPEIAHVIGQRLRGALRGGLPSDPLHRLQVRVYRRPPSLKYRS